VQSVFVGTIPAHAAYFSIYELTRQAQGHDGSQHRPLASALSGSLAVIVHDLIMTPMDVCKQRLQLGYYSGLRDCVSSILAKEGSRYLPPFRSPLFILAGPFSRGLFSSFSSLLSRLSLVSLALFKIESGGGAGGDFIKEKEEEKRGTRE